MKYKATVIIDAYMDQKEVEEELTFWLECTNFYDSEIESIEELY